jgi:predicted dehydrogenase
MIRWGVVGPGAIATEFAQAMELVTDAEIVTVGSRSIDRAQDFAARFGIKRAVGSYTDVATDPNVDVVYVATTQNSHAHDVVMLLEAGKHVLCEKPFALDANQARTMIEAARSRDLFLMDAIWSRYLPAYAEMMKVIAEGRIGEISLVEADFGVAWQVDQRDRLFDPARGGGGLLDLGIYPLQLCSLLLGSPTTVVAAGVLGSTGVDERVGAVLTYPGGALGVIKASVRTSMACSARIAGSTGVIELPAMMHCPDQIIVSSLAGRETIACHYEGSGLRFEIEEVNRCITQGLTESAVMPLDETLELMKTLDEIRAQIGLSFPGV